MSPKPTVGILDMLSDIARGLTPDSGGPVPKEAVLGIPIVELIGEIEEPALSFIRRGYFHRERGLYLQGKSEAADGDDEPQGQGLRMPPEQREFHIASIMQDFGWALLYNAVPQLNRLGGDFYICDGWRVGVDARGKVVFSEDIFSSHDFGFHFHDVLYNILLGKALYDASDVTPQNAECGIIVGRLEDFRALQFAKLFLDLKRRLARTDPFPTVRSEHAYFMGKPFDAYAMFYERRRRLAHFHGMVHDLLIMLVNETVDPANIPGDYHGESACLYVGQDGHIYLEQSEGSDE